MKTRDKILNAIIEHPGLTTREIMAIAQLSRTNTREHLQKLESMGLIYSEADDANANKHRYFAAQEKVEF